MFCTDGLAIWHALAVSQRTSKAKTDLSPALASELRAVVGKLVRKLRDQTGPEGLSSSQVSVLLRMEKDGPATASQLARGEAMRPQSMSAAIAPLVEGGLVSGAADPSDKRQTLFSLTEKCRDLLAERREAKQDWLTKTIAAKLLAQEQEQLLKALKSLARLVED